MSNRGCKSRRDGWWGLVSRCRIKLSDELGLDIKNVLLGSEMACLLASAPKCRQKTLDKCSVVRDGMTLDYCVASTRPVGFSEDRLLRRNEKCGRSG